MPQATASRIVVAAVDDIFFAAKIDAEARRAMVQLIEARDAEELSRRLAGIVPDLVILDLNGKACRPIDSIRQIKEDPRLARVPMVGFFSHVQTDLEKAAREAGCDHVIPRSVFVRNLPEILRC